jgi:hypothetical protein
MSTKKTKKSGRRDQVTTSRDRIVAEIPPACPYCDKYELESTGRDIQKLTIAGKLPDGRKYYRKESRRMKCKACGRHCFKHTFYQVTGEKVDEKSQN